MSRLTRFNEVVPIRNKNMAIPSDLLYPHYSDERFTKARTEGRTIFLAQGAIAIRGSFCGELIEGASYNYSDRISQSYNWETVELAVRTAENEIGNQNTAAYFEAKLRLLFEEPTIELLHIIAGVNRSSGHPFQVFGTASGITKE